jgi:hypothetical protein
MPHLKTLLTLLLALCLATPVAAYTIYLKDGSRILAREKYTIDGDRAIITLESGTQTFLNHDEIDVQHTEEANKLFSGNALILEDGRFVERSETEVTIPKRETLGDLIDRGGVSVRGTSRETPNPVDHGIAATTTTSVERTPRQPLSNIELTTALKEAFTERGLDSVSIFQGTKRRRPLVEITTDSEASVFRSLEVAADVLLTVRQQHADECDLMELLLTTGGRERAGEFALTAEMAESIHSKDIEIAAFFVEHVRF